MKKTYIEIVEKRDRIMILAIRMAPRSMRARAKEIIEELKETFSYIRIENNKLTGGYFEYKHKNDNFIGTCHISEIFHFIHNQSIKRIDGCVSYILELFLELNLLLSNI